LLSVSGRVTMSAMENPVAVKSVKIDCPVCLTGNYLNFHDRVDRLLCVDCGYPLVEPSVFDIRHCLFCGCERFYLQWPLLLWFLGPKPVCYLCEAEYRGIRMNSAVLKFSQTVEDSIKSSECAVRWNARAEQYLKESNEVLARSVRGREN
jgi:ribosomal protein S27AE